MRSLALLLLPIACGSTGPNDAAVLDVDSSAAAEAAVPTPDAFETCEPCHDCPADELGRKRYCDDRGVCRLEQVCEAPRPTLDAGDPRCAQWDATGAGSCGSVLGWAYDGSRCYQVIGCSCEGRDCGHLYREPDGGSGFIACSFDHALCPHGEADGG